MGSLERGGGRVARGSSLSLAPTSANLEPSPTEWAWKGGTELSIAGTWQKEFGVLSAENSSPFFFLLLGMRSLCWWQRRGMLWHTRSARRQGCAHQDLRTSLLKVGEQVGFRKLYPSPPVAKPPLLYSGVGGTPCGQGGGCCGLCVPA